MRFNLVLYAFTILQLHNILIVVVGSAIGVDGATDVHVVIDIVVCIIHGAGYTNERIIIQLRIHHIIVQMNLALIILKIFIIIVAHVVRVMHAINNSTSDANMKVRGWKGGWCWWSWRDSQWAAADAMNTSR